MKTRAIVMLGLALLLAGAAVYLARGWLQSQVPQVAEEQPQIALTKVLVATTTLYFGNTIRNEHVRLVDWPADALPPGSFQSAEELLGDDEERVVLRGMEVNEPVLKSKVSGFGGRASLSSVIAPEMRAITIRVNDVNGVAGFVLPADHVDIMLTRDKTGGQTRRTGAANLITDVLLQNVKVLGIDQQASEQVDKPSVVKAVTMEVTQFQAQKLVLAQQVGFLSLALRDVTNVAAAATRTVTLADLRVGEANLSPNAEDEKSKESKTKAVVVKKTGRKGSGRSGSSVRIVRALQSQKYEVQPERSIPSKPALSKPLNLVPTKSAPAAKAKDTTTGAAGGSGEKADGSTGSGQVIGAPTMLFRSAPTSQMPSENSLAATEQ